MKTFLISLIILVVAGFGVWLYFNFQPQVSPITKPPVASVTNFSECVAAGNPVMESYPRQCRHNNQTFTEDIGNELEKDDLIRLDFPRPNQTITSPLTLTGQARGTWFFEGDFPIILTDWDGRIIAESYATAKGEWMVEDFVPFEGTIEFEVDPNVYSKRGALILQKDNPSDLRNLDDALEIPVIFE
ncbi:Gmad2 immunoglobulin-like domain-containing protein [Patescibacteria group bacterium]